MNKEEVIREIIVWSAENRIDPEKAAELIVRVQRLEEKEKIFAKLP